MSKVQQCKVAQTILSSAFLAAVLALHAQASDVQQIIDKSVVANQAVFNAAPDFNYKERDRAPNGSKTFQVTMIEGTPYSRLIALNDQPLSAQQTAQEQKKQEQITSQRRAESPEDKQKRIAKYQKERKRDNLMMEQLTQAFDFTLMGQHKVRGFTVWVLKATPRPGYKPPNMETQVLPGMQGELWIDQKSYNWVRVTAQVIRPVSIEGFLAQVEPGTRFELENSPVGNGVWQTTHFSMKSNAKVLHMFSHNSQDDETYFGFQPNGGASSH
ncbi:MAG: hypothetical protein WB992_23745 [Bryobacteraceae bacterium]